MTYHFIGMGGIGMSALARILLQRGQTVQGSDVRASALLDQLEKEGAKVQIGHTEEMIRLGDTVVYSTDINQENVELKKARALNLPLLHRSDLLHRLMENQKPLLVTGTHGKTTTTALLAAVLLEAKLDPTFVIGGILRSANTNGRAGKGPYFVAEADESDGSFLKTPAFGAIVTNLENEHLSYWKSEENLAQGFRTFFQQAQNPSHLLWCRDDPALEALQPKGLSYGFHESADCKIRGFEQEKSGIQFDIEMKGAKYDAIDLALFGRHNALNGAAVFGLAVSLGVDEQAIRRAFKAFCGTARRLERVGSVQKIDIYDDYGHHPTEISVTLRALRDHVRERRLVVLFQPHRYSRVHDLFDGFLNCFQEADELIMTDIYAAGEAPMEGITAAALYTKLREKLGAKVRFFPRQHLESGAAALVRPGDALVTLGAGDITHVGKILLDKIAERAPKLTIGLLFGGTSSEHDVSIMSAKTFLHALDLSLYDVKQFGITKDGTWLGGSDAIEKLEQKLRIEGDSPKISSSIIEQLSECDVCIPVFHGQQGEDGMIQGLLESLDIAYVGCDYRSGALCMHKAWARHVAMMNGISAPPYIEFDAARWRRNPEDLSERIEKNLSYPVWIKPVHLGSSIGVKRAANALELQEAAALAFHYDDWIMVDREIKGREIEFSLLGNDYTRLAPPAEIITQGKFHSYATKYGSGANEIITPADLTPMEVQVGSDLARRVYEACGCKGLARIDFFLDGDGHFWFNEVNPFPGCTDTSAFPKSWQAAGLSEKALCDELIILALHRQRRLADIRGK